MRKRRPLLRRRIDKLQTNLPTATRLVLPANYMSLQSLQSVWLLLLLLLLLHLQVHHDLWYGKTSQPNQGDACLPARFGCILIAQGEKKKKVTKGSSELHKHPACDEHRITPIAISRGSK